MGWSQGEAQQQGACIFPDYGWRRTRRRGRDGRRGKGEGRRREKERKKEENKVVVWDVYEKGGSTSSGMDGFFVEHLISIELRHIPTLPC
jgi:hypothetical protein